MDTTLFQDPAFWLLTLFLVPLLLRVPIALALGFAALAVVWKWDMGLTMLSYNFFAGIAKFPLLAIPFFILAGYIMERAGIAARIVTLMEALTGSMTGGLAVATVAVATFWGAVSGSGPATVAALGLILIPGMTRVGYDRDFAAATVSVTSGLAIVIPPSIAFIVYGGIANVSVPALFAAGFVPGILVALCIMAAVVIISRKKGYRGKRGTMPAGRAFREAFWGVLTPAVILGGIYGGIFTPTEAAAVSVVYGLIVGLFIYREVKIKDLYDLLVDSGKTTGGIMLIIGAAALFSYICTVYGISKAAQTLLLTVAGNKYVFLIIINVIFLIAGCFVDANSAMYIFIPIMYPVAQQLGIDLVHFGVIATVNLAIGQVTPPVGVNLFVAIGVSDKLQNIKDKTRVTIETMSKAVWPMIIACVVALLLVTYIPFFSTVFLKGA